MTIVPQSLFDKYDEFIDHFLDDFGTDCLLQYSKQIMTTTTEIPDIKQKKTFQLPAAEDGLRQGSTNLKTVTTTEPIRLRVYWTEKDFKKISKLVLPAGSIATYGKIEDLPKVERADSLIIYSGTAPHHVEWKFSKAGESIIHGLTHKEFITFWSRS